MGIFHLCSEIEMESDPKGAGGARLQRDELKTPLSPAGAKTGTGTETETGLGLFWAE